MKSSTIKIRLNIKDLLTKVGIDKPHHLWKEFGGSKSTPKTLLEGTVEGIQFNSLERILDIVRENDPRDFEKVMNHLNASGIFEVTPGDGPKMEKVAKRKGRRSEGPKLA